MPTFLKQKNTHNIKIKKEKLFPVIRKETL